MRIDEAEIRSVRLDLVSPFETSFGRFTDRHPIIVRVRSGDIVAYGEAPTLAGPFYTAETAAGAFHVLEKHILPRVVGEDIDSPEDLHRRLAPIRGNYIAKSGIDTAIHVLFASAQGRSLSEYLGGTRDRVDCGISIGIQRDERGGISIDRLLKTVETHVAESFKRVKIKIKPGYDVEPVRAIRDAFGNGLPLQVDANSAYTLDDIGVFRKLDAYGLLLIEQPLAADDIVDHRELQRQIDTPICLDESIETVDDARKAIALESARVINVKLARVGGLYHAKRIHDYCRDRGIPVWCGGMVESAIGQSHAIALASMENFLLPADIAPSERYFKKDLIRPFVTLTDGSVDVPTAPGLGFPVDEEVLDAATIRKSVLVAR